MEGWETRLYYQRTVGGNKTAKAMEDQEFFKQMQKRGHCGIPTTLRLKTQSQGIKALRECSDVKNAWL